MPKFHALLRFAHLGTKKEIEKAVIFYARSFEQALKKCKCWPGTKKSLPLFLQQEPQDKEVKK